MDTYFYATGDIDTPMSEDDSFQGWSNYPTYLVNELFRREWIASKQNMLEQVVATGHQNDQLPFELAVLIRDALIGALCFDADKMFMLDLAVWAAHRANFIEVARDWLGLRDLPA